MTDKYEITYSEGKSFDGRGAQGSVRNAVAEQQRREMQSRVENPGAYIYSDIMAGDRNNVYRTGNFKGNAYMTVEDICRLFEDETNRRRDDKACALAMIEKENADRQVKTETRPAHAYCISQVCDEDAERAEAKKIKGSKQVVYSGDRSIKMKVEAMPGSVKDRARATLSEWCGSRVTVSEKSSWKRSSSAVAAVALCVVFALVLALPISLSIMINSESGNIASLNSQVKSKEAEIQSLEVELDRKNDRFTLEDLAVNKYGMVELDNTNYNVLTVRASDAIENFDSENQQNGAVLALLSALGLRKSGN